MASSVQETGYEDELFQYPVGPSLHCCICTNVIKDPVMCHNEHVFCRACITTHLMYSQRCPTCMQPLTVETLRQATRGIRNMLDELSIRCEFFDRGCGKFVQLGDLKRHVADCGFAPAVCSNEGCQLEVNKQDLLHHETAACALRRVTCHSCNDIRREIDTVKVNLTAINVKLGRNENSLKKIEENLKGNWRNLDRNETTIDEKMKITEENVKSMVSKIGVVQEQLNKQEERNRQLEVDNIQIKKSLDEIMRQLERMAQTSSHEFQAEEMKKEIAEAAGGMGREPKVVVAGGRGTTAALNSVEMFTLDTKKWTPLKPMNECRQEVASAVCRNYLVVTGGKAKHGVIKSVEKLPLNAVLLEHSIPWENVPVELPGRLVGHCSVVYNERCIVIGGYDFEKGEFSDRITEISFVPPYSCTLLATMPQRRCYHGVAIFGDKILIVGGRPLRKEKRHRNVLMYDITMNKCQELASLPCPVYEMATVRWDNDHVMIMGGADSDDQPLSKALMYNIKTQKSRELPNMKYRRRGCVAAVVRDTVIVMGGTDERGHILKSVEGFRFDRNGWEELPSMHEARCWPTAVVC